MTYVVGTVIVFYIIVPTGLLPPQGKLDSDDRACCCDKMLNDESK